MRACLQTLSDSTEMLILDLKWSDYLSYPFCLVNHKACYFVLILSGTASWIIEYGAQFGYAGMVRVFSI